MLKYFSTFKKYFPNLLWLHELASLLLCGILSEIFRDNAFILYVILKIIVVCIIFISNHFTLLF